MSLDRKRPQPGSWVVHFEPDPSVVERLDASPDSIPFEECVLDASEVETPPPDDRDRDEDGAGGSCCSWTPALARRAFGEAWMVLRCS